MDAHPPATPGAPLANASNPESRLVQLALTGDQAAFEGLVRQHGEALFRIGCAVLGSPDDAEDALQDAVIKLLASLRHFDHRRPLLPWLRRIMVNECLSQLRRRRETDPVPEDLPTSGDLPHQSSEAAECRRRVNQALNRLPPRQRLALTLFGLDDMDLRQTAHAMGCSTGAVKAHLHRARRKMAAQLTDLLRPEG